MAPAAEDLRIRSARPVDLDAIVTIEEASFEPARRASRRSLRRSLRSASQRVDVAQIAGSLVAFAVTWPRPRSWRIYDVAVHPDHQGRGVGRALVAAIEAAAQVAGAQRIVLEADARRPELIAFYERAGYGAVSRLKGYYGPRRDAVRLVKRLAPTG